MTETTTRVPTSLDIRTTANLLTKVLDCRMPNQPIETPATTGDTQHRGLPSVQACYDAFEALPDDHPIKGDIDPVRVMLGYLGLKELQFDPDRNYMELTAVYFIAIRP